MADKSHKYIYVYKTTNIKNGKYYIGVRCTNYLNDGYIGCGIKSLKDAKNKTKTHNGFCFAVVKYGYENFKKNIIRFFNSKEEAYLFESSLVTKKEVCSDDCYNIALGGMYNKRVSRYLKYKQEWNKLYKDGYSINKIAKMYKSNYAAVNRQLDSKIKRTKKQATSRKIKCINTGKIYKSLSECSRCMFEGKSRSGISKVALGQQSSLKGYKFEYV